MNTTQPPSGGAPSATNPKGAAFPDLNALALELADVAVSFAQSLHRGEPPHRRLHLAGRLQELRELFGDPRAELGVLTGFYALWRWERVDVPDADPERYKQWRCGCDGAGAFIECLTRGAGEGTKGSKTWRAGNYSHGTMIYTSPPGGDLFADKALARHIGGAP